MTRLLSLLAVLALLIAACGDDDDTATDDPSTDVDEDATESVDTDDEDDSEGPYSTEDYAAVLAADLQAGQHVPGDEDQIACVAEGFVEAIGGADALNDAGLTPAELAAAQGPDDLRVELDEEAVADELVPASTTATTT